MTEESGNSLRAKDRTTAFVHETISALAPFNTEGLDLTWEEDDYQHQHEVLQIFRDNLETEWGKGLEQGRIPQQEILGFLDKALSEKWNENNVKVLYGEFVGLARRRLNLDF